VQSIAQIMLNCNLDNLAGRSVLVLRENSQKKSPLRERAEVYFLGGE
jgi:hypothetical protein